MNDSAITYYEVAVAGPLPQTFTYHSHEDDVEPGTRVLVPFGPRKLLAVVLEKHKESKTLDYKTRSLGKKLEETAIFSQELLKLARWLSSYYHSPFGEVLKAMIPQGSGGDLTKTWHLKEDLTGSKPEQETLLKKLFGKKKSLSFATIQKKYKKLAEMNPQLPSLESLKRKKLIKETLEEKRKRNSLPTEQQSSEEKTEPKQAPELTQHQAEALESFWDAKKEQNPLKPFLLHGITGSGKTEVYLRILEATLKSNSEGKNKAQALVLVPEISLTPQMRSVFEERFPGQISVLHSALPEKERYCEIMKIHRGETRILIGARSSVFAPFQNLKLIVVDEEHDTSYKQSTQFCYQGRDVALLRAHWLGIPIILGSATPSAESFWKATQGRYNLLQLPERAQKAKLPEVHLKGVEALARGQKLYPKSPQDEDSFKDLKLVSEDILEALKENFEKNKQSIVIVNRRGYAYYLLDLETKKGVQCSSCSVSMTLHNKMKHLTCHYCDKKILVSELMKEKGKSYVAIGHGSQKIELFLRKLIPEAHIVRLDSDTARNRDRLEETLEDFRQEKIDILVGTQILAKGHDFPKVTLVALLEVDEQLNLPDFRAGERTFQLLVQAAGRAGRAEDNSHVYIQTVQEDEPLIQDAITHNYEEFIHRELGFREKYAYPPFFKLALLAFSSPQLALLESYTEALSTWLGSLLDKEPETYENLRLQGPYTPGIERINGRWRKHILLRSSEPKEIHRLLNLLILNNKNKPSSIRFKIDVDPQSLL